MDEQQPVDAATYAAHLERLDRIGREALAADPAEAITLVREANELVTELLPMHRSLMDELAHHREALQAACDELAHDAEDRPPVDADRSQHTDGEPPRSATDAGAARLDRLDGLGGDDGGDVPF